MNRVDNIVEFNYLNKEDIMKIIDMKIDELKNKYFNKISVKIDKSIYDDILKMSNYEVYGARKIDKIIKDKIEVQIIDSIIDDKKEVCVSDLMQTT